MGQGAGSFLVSGRIAGASAAVLRVSALARLASVRAEGGLAGGGEFYFWVGIRMRVAAGKDWLMDKEVWTTPGGMYKVITFTPDGYDENETREERAERVGLDLSVLQKEDDETPEEKAERVARASAEVKELFEEIGFTPTEEQKAEVEALWEYMGWQTPNSEEG